MSKKTARILFIVGFIIIAIGVVVFFSRDRTSVPLSPNPQPGQEENSVLETDTLSPAEDEGFDLSKHSIDDPSSIWIIANKQRPLPNDYVPGDLVVPDVRLRLSPAEEQMQFRKVGESQLKAMFDAAADDGITLVFGSGYRSYSLQKQFYDSYVARDGQAAADRYSARPGTSEHQTGLSFDATSPSGACHLEICFKDTPQGSWLANNAHTYGFIVRYLDGKESITGYQYEPWHMRFVGKELAEELYSKNQTMEEFFGL